MQVLDQGWVYRTLFDAPAWRYRGADLAAGSNVDLVLSAPYRWPEFDDDDVDLVVSGQAIEHMPHFWMAAMEMGRIVRPGGLVLLVAPSAGGEHRFPVDCYRFLGDGMQAIAAYLGFEVLDCFTDRKRGVWQESFLLMRKPVWDTAEHDAFRRRVWHHHALLDPDAPLPPTAAPPRPSVLRTVPAGRLEPVLEAIRAKAVAEETRRNAPSFMLRVLRRLRLA